MTDRLLRAEIISESNATAMAAAPGPFAPGHDQLRVVACGSVDDGKSTLIGRLLLDAALTFDDQGAALAEHAQGTKNDVAYRYFGTPRRRFVVADTPGRKDCTRNVVTGASKAELAILLVDAEKGLLEQTQRHALVCSLLGIRQFVLAINKMDLVDFDEPRFRDIAEAFAQFASRFPQTGVTAIPTSGLHGDNVVRRSARMPWYQGLSLLEHLETVTVEARRMSAPAESPMQRTDAFAAHLVWMSETSLLPGRAYLLKAGAQTIGATVTEIKHRIDIDNFDHLAAKELHLNEIAFVNVSTAEPISFDPYEENRDTGGFTLIDRYTNATVAAGMIRFGLRRAANTFYHSFDVTKSARARLNAQKPALLWFTGLSGAGKSTIADHLEKKLHALGKHTFVLDGDNVRHGLNRDLGFTEADRVENIRRVAEVAKLFVEAGLVTLVSFISPFRAEREMARELVAPGEFIEIFVDTPLAVCEERDPKGLYKKARRGELKNFTGLDSPYEPPLKPELLLDAGSADPGDLADRIIDFMHRRGMLS